MTPAPERSEALQAFRTARTDGLPPPPARLAATTTLPVRDVATPPAARPEPAANERDSFTMDELVKEPVRTCRRMATLREDLPARPLNVDLTPETAFIFNERCRELRVKKKDVVEVLLRAWLEVSSQDLH